MNQIKKQWVSFMTQGGSLSSKQMPQGLILILGWFLILGLQAIELQLVDKYIISKIFGFALAFNSSNRFFLTLLWLSPVLLLIIFRSALSVWMYRRSYAFWPQNRLSRFVFIVMVTGVLIPPPILMLLKVAVKLFDVSIVLSSI